MPRKCTRSATPSSPASSSSCRPQRPVAGQRELRVHPASHAGRVNAASSSSTRLISVIRPSQAIRSASSPTPRRARSAAASTGSAVARSSRSRPSRTTSNFSNGAMPLRDQFVAHLGADGDQLVRRARERALRLAKRERLCRPEVPAEHMAVEGVHDHRRIGNARDRRRQPSDRSSLRGVGVQDVRPQRADQIAHPQHGADVVARRRCHAAASAGRAARPRDHELRTPSNLRPLPPGRQQAWCHSRARQARASDTRRAMPDHRRSGAR